MIRRKGFTLLELVIVVIIIAILAGLGIPQFVKTVERAKASEGNSLLGAIRGAQLRYYAEYTAYSSSMDALDVTMGQLRNFDSSTLVITAGNPNNIASIRKTIGTMYTLSIAANGVLACAGAAGNCPAGY